MRSDEEIESMPPDGFQYEDHRYAVDLDDEYSASGFLRVTKPENLGATVGYLTGRSLMAKFQLSHDKPRTMVVDDAFGLVVEIQIRQNTKDLRARVYVQGQPPAESWMNLATW